MGRKLVLDTRHHQSVRGHPSYLGSDECTIRISNDEWQAAAKEDYTLNQHIARIRLLYVSAKTGEGIQEAIEDLVRGAIRYQTAVDLQYPDDKDFARRNAEETTAQMKEDFNANAELMEKAAQAKELSKAVPVGPTAVAPILQLRTLQQIEAATVTLQLMYCAHDAVPQLDRDILEAIAQESDNSDFKANVALMVDHLRQVEVLCVKCGDTWAAGYKEGSSTHEALLEKMQPVFVALRGYSVFADNWEYFTSLQERYKQTPEVRCYEEQCIVAERSSRYYIQLFVSAINMIAAQKQTAAIFGKAPAHNPLAMLVYNNVKLTSQAYITAMAPQGGGCMAGFQYLGLVLPPNIWRLYSSDEQQCRVTHDIATKVGGDLLDLAALIGFNPDLTETLSAWTKAFAEMTVGSPSPATEEVYRSWVMYPMLAQDINVFSEAFGFNTLVGYVMQVLLELHSYRELIPQWKDEQITTADSVLQFINRRLVGVSLTCVTEPDYKENREPFCGGCAFLSATKQYSLQDAILLLASVQPTMDVNLYNRAMLLGPVTASELASAKRYFVPAKGQ